MTDKDKTAQFLGLVESHKGILYKVANAYCKNAEDRKDLTQEIILQLWKSFDNYDERFAHSTWIYRISLNVAISFYRKERSRERISGALTADIFDYSEVIVPEQPDSRLGILYRIISGLKDLDKGLILLYLEEKSYSEIAEIMGITLTNVATKIGRIKTRLKKEFEQQKIQ